MKINNFEKKKIINSFPNIKPFYEKNLHKKVTNKNNLYVIIPKGKKYFIWFTKFKGVNVCILLFYSKKSRSIEHIEIKQCSFNNILTSGIGSIFYGTLLNIESRIFLNIESIYFYKGYNLLNENEYTKLKYLEYAINYEIKQKFYSNKSVVLGISVMSNNYNNIKKMLSKVSFPVYCIQHRNWNYNRCYYNERIKTEIIREAVFRVEASNTTDIYNLFYYNKGKLEFYGLADVPTYKASVYLNRLFRNIRENEDLDDIEMSDDEEDFQDISCDKYLKKGISYNMKCIYNRRFKKWTPINISDDKIINKNQILFLEK